MKLSESSFAQKTVEVFKAEGYEVGDNEILIFLEAIIEGASDYLRIVKNKQKNAVVFKDLKSNFIMAAVLEYNVNEEDEDAQDNYNYYWTFDKNDIDENTNVYENTQTQVQALVNKRMHDKAYTVTEVLMAYIEGKILGMLVDFCDSLAVESDTVVVSHEGFFEITIGVENGRIVKAMVPDGPMKVLIKDDASTVA